MALQIFNRIAERIAPQSFQSMRQDYWKFKEDFDRRVTKKVRRAQSSLALRARLAFGNNDGLNPNELFGAIDDEQWLQLMTVGYRERPALREFLPGLPEEKIQLRFTGNAGDKTLTEGFHAYRLFKNIVRKHCGAFVSRDILDFGCGWGRIIRFFLKETSPERLWGVDCLEEAIQICKETNRWCKFQLIQPRPPMSFPDESFDLIYSYSVFSHLSEDVHLQWLEEFRRLLRPKGLLIATTWPRDYILECARLRNLNAVPFFKGGAASSFVDTEKFLTDYDNGKFCYSPVGGGGILDGSFYGETCISRTYASRYWSKYFTLRDYIDDRDQCAQNVIVVEK